jgi:putative ABC transport system permease protein
MAQDIRAILRSLRRSPIFSVTAIVTLAVGIGASTAMFGIVHAVLLRPLPFHEPDRLVQIWESKPREGRDKEGVAAATFSDWRERSRTFDDLAFIMVDGVPTVLAVGEETFQARRAVVTPNLLAVLGIRPALGLPFDSTVAPASPLEPSQVILSHGLWHRAFGADPAVVGRTVRVEGTPGHVVVGVMPPEFSFPEAIDFWMPSGMTGPESRRDVRFGRVVGRLRPDASPLAARTDLESVAAGLSREHPATNAGWTIHLESLHHSTTGHHRLALLTLFAATAFIVLVGCANLSNLLLARGVAQQSDLAVRTALGASRTRIFRLLLTEACGLALAGGIAGLLLAKALIPLLGRMAEGAVPRIAEAQIDTAVLAFGVAMSAVAAILAGLLPAVRLSHTDLQTAMRPAGERSTRRAGDAQLQTLVIAGELALCLVLGVGAMLLIRTFVSLNTLELGFDPAHVISIDARFPMYRTMARNRWQLVAGDTTAVLARLRSVPDIEAVSAINHAPLSGTIVPAEVTLPGELGRQTAVYRNITPGYFATLGIPLVAGRDFRETDISDLARLPAPRPGVRREGVAIINETTARRFWPDGGALGRLLSTEYDPGISARRVIGIARDTRSGALREAPPVEVYVPYLEDPSFAMTLLVRTRTPPDVILPAIREGIRRVAPDLSTANIQTLDTIVAGSMGSAPFNALIVSSFAAAAFVLSAIGIFGMFAYGVAARAREIGIRMALGASPSDVTRLFLREAAIPVAVGVVAGAFGAWTLAGTFSALLFGVTPTDLGSFAAAAVLLAAVALTASYLPLRKALSADPAASLRI